jgi:hypothetical protein
MVVVLEHGGFGRRVVLVILDWIVIRLSSWWRTGMSWRPASRNFIFRAEGASLVSVESIAARRIS